MRSFQNLFISHPACLISYYLRYFSRLDAEKCPSFRIESNRNRNSWRLNLHLRFGLLKELYMTEDAKSTIVEPRKVLCNLHQVQPNPHAVHWKDKADSGETAVV